MSKILETNKDKILKAQKRDYSNQSATTKDKNLKAEDLQRQPGTNKLKDQPATKWRGDED